MPKRLIVLTGPSGAGKSTFAKQLQKHLPNYTHHNVGDALAENLGYQTPLLDPKKRRLIGPAFLDKFGKAGYIKLLINLAQLDRIVDGVRLLVGLAALRKSFPDLLHIHKAGQSFSTGQYDSDLLQQLADVEVPWQNKPDFDQIIQMILRSLE